MSLFFVMFLWNFGISAFYSLENDIKFTRVGLKSWTDSSNWGGETNEAIPHLERVPCSSDHILFPSESTFYVGLPKRSSVVATVTIQGMNISGELWNDFLYSSMGSKEFIPGVHPEASGVGCYGDDCECNNDQLLEEVCAHKINEPSDLCDDPIHPIGFCHQICGVSFLFKNVLTATVRREVEEFSRNEYVWTHTSKVNGFVQVVLREKTDYSGSIIKFGHRLRNHFNTMGIGQREYSFRFSGLQKSRSSPGSFFVMFILSMTLSLITFTVLFCMNKKESCGINWRKVFRIQYTVEDGRYAFARFENPGGAVQLGFDKSAQAANEESSRAFDNPMFSEEGPLPVESMILNNLPNEITSDSSSSE